MSQPRDADVSSLTDSVPHMFSCVDGTRYRLALDELGIAFEIDRLRRDRHELIGELAVTTELAGARTVVDGVLSIGDFNLSSIRARQDRARYLAERAQAPDLDWGGLLEELCQRVLAAERQGQPAVSLRDLPRPTPGDTFEVDGLTLLARHPVVLFGDGGAAKSYLALYVAGRLAACGLRVGIFDWELAGEDHRDRLERLFGPDMPEVRYARCERPLIAELDRLHRIARELDYAIYDSVAFACDGPPEAAEIASAYFRAVRQIGIGSLHIAHISKADGADQKPFGSAFWHNGARSTWYVRLAESLPDARTIALGLHNRKANLGARRPAVGFEITFSDDRTTFRRVNVADVPDLAAGLSLSQRIRAVLRAGARTRPEIAADFPEEKAETLRRTIKRAIDSGYLVRFPGPGGQEQIGLPARRAEA